MKWINATGMIFQFVSFWFAAPELLGASTLKRFEKGLRKLISFIPVFLLLLVITGYGLTFTIIGILKGVKAGTEGISNNEFNNYLFIVISCTVIYLLLMIFYRKLRNWLDTKLAIPLTEKLITNNHTRQLALIIGAVLFTAGFLHQMISIFI